MIIANMIDINYVVPLLYIEVVSDFIILEILFMIFDDKFFILWFVYGRCKFLVMLLVIL